MNDRQEHDVRDNNALNKTGHDHSDPNINTPSDPPSSHTSHENGGHADHSAMITDYWRRFVVSIILSVPILALSPMIQGWFRYSLDFPGDLLLLFILSTAIYFYGGWPFLTGLIDELSERRPGMMTLVGLAISVAYLYSSATVFGFGNDILFWELATLIDVMLIGHLVEMRSIMGASKALEELAKVMPSIAHLVVNGKTEDVKIDELAIGDLVLVKPGEKIPADGVIKEGSSHVDESLLTGESMPVAVSEGREVIGGSVNSGGSLIIEVRRIGEETYLNQVINIVERAQESRSRTQNLADRAAMILVIVAVAAGILTFTAWIIISNDTSFAMERSVTVMVISCPHALGLAIPLVVAVSTALAASSGFLIRERQAFEEARGINAIIFDKTGTLTEGRLGVIDILTYENNSKADVLSLSASVESLSEHPIASAIVQRASQEGLDIHPVTNFKASAGQGVEGTINERKIQVMGPGPLRELGLPLPDDRAEKLASHGNTVIFIIADNNVIGAIALADIIRSESKKAVSDLKEMGLRTIMLTGDNKFVAKSVAEELGLDEYYAEVLPHDKASIVQMIQKDGPTVMVGDGINDAPALVQSDLGIAIGGGTDVAIESADIILVQNDPRDIVKVLSLSRKTYSKMQQNLLFATGYNAVAIPLAAGVLSGYGIILSPAIGAILMSASTVIVAINARLLK
ncbi:MAG: copper-translocating P-type ATPase [Euryarchaeota archaeon]|nr:copper-translocating P-type ATPase [Euryarchaeota archaeon]